MLKDWSKIKSPRLSRPKEEEELSQCKGASKRERTRTNIYSSIRRSRGDEKAVSK
jgi:hypothetical protein